MSTPSAEVALQVAANSAAAQLDMFTRKFKQMSQEMSSEIRKTNQEARRANEQTKKTAESAGESGKGFSVWSSDIIKASIALYAMHAPIKILNGMVNLVKQEIMDVIELAEKSANRQVPFQHKFMNLIRNIPANENAEQLAPIIHKMIMDSSVSDKVALVDMIEAAASSTAGMDYLERVKIGMPVFESRPDLVAGDQGALKALSSAVVYLHSIFKEFGSTPQAQQSFLEKAKLATLIPEDEQFHKVLGTIPGEVAASFGKQYNEFEIMALATALNVASGDKEGPTTRTQVMNFIADLFTKFSAYKPEMKNKSLMEQLGFLQGTTAEAEKIRGELLGTLMNEGDLSAEEQTLVEMALAGDKGAKRELQDKPDITGRAKSKYVIAQLLKRASDINMADQDINYYMSVMTKGVNGAQPDLPIVMRPDGTVDVVASYAKSQQIGEQTSQFFKNSKLFQTAETSDSMLSALDTGRLGYAKWINGLRNQTHEILQSLGKGVISRGEESFSWMMSTKGTPKDQAIYHRDLLESVTKQYLARSMTLPSDFMPELIGDPMRERNRLPNAVNKIWGGGITDEEALRFGISSENQSLINRIDALIEQFQKIASGDKPLPVKDTAKPRAEPRKGEWRP